MPQSKEKLKQGSLRQERLHASIELRKYFRLMSPIGNPVKERKHKRKALHDATWPRTPGQHRQSRPLIVTTPIKRLKNNLAMYLLDVGINAPKHLIDKAYIRL